MSLFKKIYRIDYRIGPNTYTKLCKARTPEEALYETFKDMFYESIGIEKVEKFKFPFRVK